MAPADSAETGLGRCGVPVHPEPDRTRRLSGSRWASDSPASTSPPDEEDLATRYPGTYSVVASRPRTPYRPMQWTGIALALAIPEESVVRGRRGALTAIVLGGGSSRTAPTASCRRGQTTRIVALITVAKTIDRDLDHPRQTQSALRIAGRHRLGTACPGEAQGNASPDIQRNTDRLNKPYSAPEEPAKRTTTGCHLPAENAIIF